MSEFLIAEYILDYSDITPPGAVRQVKRFFLLRLFRLKESTFPALSEEFVRVMVVDCSTSEIETVFGRQREKSKQRATFATSGSLQTEM